METAAGPPAQGIESLTPRERDVLRLLSLGLCYRTIGERLFISERTVEGRVTKIFKKLRVRNRAEAALIAHDGLGARDGNTGHLLAGLSLLLEGLHEDELAALRDMVENALAERCRPLQNGKPNPGTPPRKRRSLRGSAPR